MRICSLLPSATEIIFALGMGESVVGVSHECDFPSEASRLPKVTRSNIPSAIPSHQIDSLVSSTLATQGSLYELDLPLLEHLQPDLILTQKLCDVCAVSFDRVEQAVKTLSSHPKLLNIEPSSLDDIFRSILYVAAAAGAEDSGKTLVNSLKQRVETIRGRTAGVLERPRVLCMEWVDPPYCGGHWMKELVEIAGGEDKLANRNRPSYRIEWNRVLEFNPEVIVLTCCGFELERTEQEASLLAGFEGAMSLRAVRADRVFATDSSHFFSRSGPRIVESLEILAHLVHPELFAAPVLPRAFRRARLTQLQAIK